jgi:hypothetical protein
MKLGMRWVLIPCCVGAALVLLLGSMAGTSGARTKATGSVAKPIFYEAVHALVIVKDKATYSYSGVKWDGFGRLVQKLGPSGLPILLARGGGPYPINISDHETSNGDETLTTSGVKDKCSGSWVGESRRGAIVLKVKQAGAGKLQTLWELPTGFASPECGRLYDQFGGGIEVGTTVDGEIGDPHLNLNIEGKETETSADGSTQQTIQWEGRVILARK